MHPGKNTLPASMCIDLLGENLQFNSWNSAVFWSMLRNFPFLGFALQDFCLKVVWRIVAAVSPTWRIERSLVFAPASYGSHISLRGSDEGWQQVEMGTTWDIWNRKVWCSVPVQLKTFFNSFLWVDGKQCFTQIWNMVHENAVSIHVQVGYGQSNMSSHVQLTQTRVHIIYCHCVLFVPTTYNMTSHEGPLCSIR